MLQIKGHHHVCWLGRSRASQLPLTEGSILKGEVIPVNASEIIVTTDYGVIRIPATKLTEEGKKLAWRPGLPYLRAAVHTPHQQSTDLMETIRS